VLVVEKKEVHTLVLPRSSRLIVNQVSMEMLPSVIVIVQNSLLVVSEVNPNTRSELHLEL
jgi:hypothetical protein